ncbi:MAG TPA: GNAT family N-acetyltransferase [Dehalococcoidia bacterium]|nr:GNAT family N-acetyltransferase [Dehalococcoidia bacterium]
MDGFGLEMDAQRRECWTLSFRHDGLEVARAQLHCHGGDVFDIVDLYVDPDWRGRGLGRQVLAQCLGFALAQGARMVTAHTSPENAPAFRLFSSAGFSPCCSELHLELRLGQDHHHAGPPAGP